MFILSNFSLYRSTVQNLLFAVLKFEDRMIANLFNNFTLDVSSIKYHLQYFIRNALVLHFKLPYLFDSLHCFRIILINHPNLPLQ